jgi:CHAT domain-containing protein/tetratricopeptide (TPR) repeat protein
LDEEEKLFVERLSALSLDEGKVFIQEQSRLLKQYDAVSHLLRNEARRQEQVNPLVALKLAELLIFFGEHTQLASARASGLVAKGDALKLIGHHQAALYALDEAGDEFLRMGDELAWARTRMSWIISATWLGHVEDALREAARARAAFEKHSEHYWVCAVDHNTAMIYRQQGRYQEVSDIYERLLNIYPTLSGQQSEEVLQRAIAMAQANQGLILLLLGQFTRATTLLQDAQERFKGLGQSSAVVKIEVHLAEIEYLQGYYGSALRRYYQARDTMLQHNLVNGPMPLALLKLRIADCLVKLNRANEACQLAEEAVRSYREIGVLLDTGEALREYATTLIACGRTGEALKALNEAEDLFVQGDLGHYAAATRLQHAELLLINEAIPEAYKQASTVQSFFDAKGLVLDSVRARLVLVGALIECTRRTNAEQEQERLLNEATLLCKEATARARQHNLQEQVYKGQHLFGRVAELRGNIPLATRHYQAAIAQIERILPGLAHDLSPAFLHTAWTVYEDMIALYLRQKKAQQAFSCLERARSVVLRRYLHKSRMITGSKQHTTPAATEFQAKSAALLQTQRELADWQREYRKYSRKLANGGMRETPISEQEAVQTELKRCEARLNELFERLHLYELDLSSIARPKSTIWTEQGRLYSEQSIPVEQLQAHLSPEEGLLAYFLYQGKLVIFIMTRERLQTYEQSENVALLERYLPLLYAHLQPGGWYDPQRPPVQQVRGLLKKLYNLLLAPVLEMLPAELKLLTIVPYGPLHNLPFHALYDGERFLIERYQVSYLPASSLLTQLRDIEQTTRPRTGTPLIFGYSGGGKLQQAVNEAKLLHKMLHGRCYLESEATIERLQQEATGSSLIHIATHGHSRLDAPNFSSVLLVDGQLNALDAFALDLQGCSLVALSGCETGLSLNGGGDEQLGLGRAFLAAGASSLVMSLWPVEDAATSKLMLCFYQHLLQGASRVEALSRAQRELLAESDTPYAHPYFWAAFRLVGAVGPLSIS